MSKVLQGTQIYDTRSYSEIPDLWHIAQNHPDPASREAILKVWHVAHAYMKAINKISRHDIHAEIDLND